MTEHDDMREQVARAIASVWAREGDWPGSLSETEADAALAVMLPALEALRAERDAALAEVARLREFAPTHRHRKGGLYQVIGRGRIEADLTPAVIYRNEAGDVWVRPAAEFDDGRFAALAAEVRHD